MRVRSVSPEQRIVFMRSHWAGDSLVFASKERRPKLSAQSESFCVSLERLYNLMAGHFRVAKQLQMSLPARL